MAIINHLQYQSGKSIKMIIINPNYHNWMITSKEISHFWQICKQLLNVIFYDFINKNQEIIIILYFISIEYPRGALYLSYGSFWFKVSQFYKKIKKKS